VLEAAASWYHHDESLQAVILTGHCGVKDSISSFSVTFPKEGFGYSLLGLLFVRWKVLNLAHVFVAVVLGEESGGNKPKKINNPVITALSSR
jgi:hypothetical protein